MNSVAQDFVLEPNDKDRIAYLVGPEDENLKQLDKRLGVKISYSGAHFHVEGSHAAVKKAVKLVKSLYIDTTPTKNSKKPSEVTPDMVHLAITEVAHLEDDDNDYQNAEDRGSVGAIYHKANNFKTKRGFVKARTSNQSDYISKISGHDVSFGIGPAGTGKNFIAKQVADALGLDFYFSNAVTQEYKITGYGDANGEFVKTQFFDAFTKGGLFLLDEMDASCPEALIVPITPTVSVAGVTVAPSLTVIFGIVGIVGLLIK